MLEDHVVQDVGRVLNPALVEGQQHGAAAQAVGWATLEALVHDEHGQLLSGTFLDYALPRVEDVGRLDDDAASRSRRRMARSGRRASARRRSSRARPRLRTRSPRRRASGCASCR